MTMVKLLLVFILFHHKPIMYIGIKQLCRRLTIRVYEYFSDDLAYIKQYIWFLLH